jgi:hypothetical protein
MELNHIYTEKPRNNEKSRNIEFGWFCREHAMHLFILSRLLGYKSEIHLGDFRLHTESNTYTSYKSDFDHAWCSINCVEPIDFSVSLIYLEPEYTKNTMVYGCSNSKSELNVELYNKENDDKLFSRERKINTITYNKKKVVSISPLDLLENPFQFLFSPPSGYPNFIQFFGADVFYQITWHCYRIVNESIKPLHNYRDSISTVKGIIKFNPDARIKVQNILQHKS